MKTDVLVIGSSAAGLVSATTAKRVYPEKDVTVVTRMPQTLVPCGIPYIFGTLGSSDKDVMPVSKMFEGAGVNLVHNEVVSIDRENRRAFLADDSEIGYDKLVLGTGSLPSQPGWLAGQDLDKVFSVPKDKCYLDNMMEKLAGCQQVVVIGAGFIGVEISDELVKAGKKVQLVEQLPHILGMAFDEDVATRIESLVKERGVEILTGVGVQKILGNQAVSGVGLNDGQTLKADAVILAMGYRPNVELAERAGLAMSSLGFIRVDEYMRTEDPNIYAVGDCAEKRDFITRKAVPTMLASTACAEGRIAGMNLFKLSAIKTFNGTISIFSTAVGNAGAGVAGLTEKVAERENFNYVVGAFEGLDRHPGTLADTHAQFVKLVVGKESGVILGGEVYGGLSAGELINTIGLIIQARMTVNSLLTAQVGSHPLMSASPAGYPLIKAAESAMSKMLGH